MAHHTSAGPTPSAPAVRYVRDGRAGFDRLTRDEWLLTNGLGGYAMGTVSGVPTRRYHGLLVASLAPPVERMVALHSVAETVIIEPGTDRERTIELASFRFRGGAGPVVHPRGFERLARFEKDVECRWAYRAAAGADAVDIVKTLRLVGGRNEARLSYTVRSSAPVRLTVRPLVALRDHHELQTASHAREFVAEAADGRVRVACGLRRVELSADAVFHADGQWWYGFEYEHERDRGFDSVEDLFSPGVFEFPVHKGGESACTLVARVAVPGETADAGTGNRSGADTTVSGLDDERDRRAVTRLVAAGRDFVVRRGSGASTGASVIAGYPWFGDWGRDTLIALPGLLLTTGRLEEAGHVLETFAKHRRHGLIPNLFNDRTGEAEYNTVDASLWFVRAACEYAAAAGGRPLGRGSPLRIACDEIIDAYRAGTDHGIRMDPRDGLISAGDESSQLTWMDAKRDGTVFTPRHGKAVEINAIWHHGLRALADAIGGDDRARAEELRAQAGRVGASFRAAFWDESRGCCSDVLHPTPGESWTASRQLRPNQIFAVSLTHSPLTGEQQRRVVAVVRGTLLTPHGLRTLDPADPAYRGRYHGTMGERDAAYHNGTAWPWLLGPFAEAVMRSEGFSASSRAEARRLLSPLVERLDGESVGQLPEVFDGDDSPAQPQSPGGCMAQAWSVAETLRVWVMAARGAA